MEINKVIIKYIGEDRNNYYYDIDGYVINFNKKMNENEIKNLVEYVYDSLINFKDFREEGLIVPLRNFMIIGYLFFKDELFKYLISFMEDLIFTTDSKKISEMLILRYVFNSSQTQCQYAIHASNDRSEFNYNQKIKEFISSSIYEGKKEVLRVLLINKDIEKIAKKMKLLTLTYVLDIWGTELLNEASEYFEYIIREIHIPQNKILSLNPILATGTGLTHKSVKDNKNALWTPKKESLYIEINRLIDNYEQEFVISEEESKYLGLIEYSLINYKSLNEGKLKKLTPSRIIKICMERYMNQFSLYLAKICDDLIKQNSIINRALVVTKIFDGISIQTGNHIYTYYKSNSKYTVMEELIVKKIKEQVYSIKLYNYNFEDDIWILRQKEKEIIRRYTINFSSLENSIIKNELKKYYDFQIKKLDRNMEGSQGLPKCIMSSAVVIESVRYLISKLNIKSSYDIQRIHVHKLIKYWKHEYRTKQGKKVKISTIEGIVTQLKSFIYWLMENPINGVIKPISNEFEIITIKGVTYENTEIIPDSVVDEILLHLDELEISIQRIFLIMINCGLRFKEIKYLEADCISESTGDVKILKYIPYKVLEARRRNGLDDYHRVIIDNEIYLEIINQIDYSSKLRRECKEKEVFLEKDDNGLLTLINSTKFCRDVQKLIDKYDIKDENGELWKITAKQFRKTLAVDMITKGNAKPREVSEYLGHLNENTTEQYYNEVRKLKLADMNSDFFKKKFHLFLNDEELQPFSEEERKSLYIDFCLSSREVEFGVCIKHFSTEPCQLRGDIWGCASCSKICTGKKYLNRWVDVFSSQKDLVDELEKNYIQENIPKEEYVNFREFQRELSLMNIFQEVIEKIEGVD